jgi:coiled-coil domain-containing protein 12
MTDTKNEETVGHLEDEALKRKERLKALKQKKFNIENNISDSNSIGDANTEDDATAETAFPKPIFRNYNPSDDTLKPGVLPKPNLVNIENEIKEQLENAKPEPLIQKDIDLATLAPQKIDWDLKRDADKKLKLLEKRTQHAIIELIRERLQNTQNSDFAELISVGPKPRHDNNEDDD